MQRSLTLTALYQGSRTAGTTQKRDSKKEKERRGLKFSGAKKEEDEKKMAMGEGEPRARRSLGFCGIFSQESEKPQDRVFSSFQRMAILCGRLEARKEHAEWREADRVLLVSE